MKKSKILIIALVVCLAALGAGAVLIFSDNIGLTYAHADQYTAGETTITKAVENLDVNWISGSIRIEYHAGDGILITETGNKTISGEDQMRWWLDGTTLRIQYAKSGRFRLFDTLEKTLTISMPEGTVLKTAKIHTTSGDIRVPSLTADEAELTVTSGKVNAEVTAKTVKSEATSGDLDIRVNGEADSVDLKITSGSIKAALEDAKKVTLKSTSGDIRVDGKAGEADISATSGKINVRFDAFDQLNIDVTSGDVRAELPETPGFTGKVTVTSGSIETGIPMAKDGDTYTCGDGSGTCNIHATSGNIRIEKAD